MNRIMCIRSDGIGSPFNMIVRILFMVSTLDYNPLPLALMPVTKPRHIPKSSFKETVPHPCLSPIGS